MFHRWPVFVSGLFLSVLGSSAFGQAITVEGVTDRTTYVAASRSFRVPTIPGHSYLVLLDGKPVPAGVTNLVATVDYHEISVARTNVSTGDVAHHLVRFILASPNRNNSGDGPENGLIEWTPYPLVPSTGGEVAGATLDLMMPQAYPPGLELPVIARVSNPSGHARRANGFVTAGGYPAIKILRGHGSALFPAATAGQSIEYSGQLASISAYREAQIDVATTWTTVSGTLSGAIDWPANSRIHITGNTTIPAGSSLSIGPGTVVKISPLVNITNSGSMTISGTVDEPVVFTSTGRVVPHVRTFAWGGFLLRGTGARLVANGTIFVGGGGAASFSFSPGDSHRSEQAVFLAHSGARLFLTNCAVINTAGQLGNGYNSDVTLDHCLVQRAITCGEYVGGTIIVNESALIEFPEDNGQVNTTIANADYDAIYFTTGTHLIYDSLIGFCKDDAIDSGSGGAGTVFMTNCWVESALHEANAWSGGGRVVTNYDSVLINSGQGFESGWSSGANSPLCYGGNILSTANSVGARLGDNYPSIGPYNGTLNLTNSYLLYNYRDAWGLTWRTDSTGWYYRSNQMDIRDGFLTEENAFHPDNTIWDGAGDGWRLARFMTTPADAAVGIGFATWTNQLPLNTTIFAGIPVRLSSFTTNSVSVDFVIRSGAITFQTGTLTFAAGETIKQIYPGGFSLESTGGFDVVLQNPVSGELTGQTQISYRGLLPEARVYAFVPGAQLDSARVVEGLPVALTSPTTEQVTVDYEYEAASGVLSTGAVTFSPGQTLAWTPVPASALSEDIIRVKLSNPTAPLSGPSTIYYVKSDGAGATPPPVMLLPRGSVWKYPNTAGALADTWRTTGFNDSAWLSGPTELGFGDGDEARTITRFNNQITYYFRTTFIVDDPDEFTDLSVWMRRDDGVVAYINGTEAFRGRNMPPFPTVITSTTEAGDEGDNIIETATISSAALVAGVNLIAAEVHQDDPGSSDISFNFEVAGNPVPPPPPPQRVYMATFDGQLTLAWGDATFVLQSAPEITGPWTTVATTSPFFVTPDPNTPRRFFQLRR